MFNILRLADIVVCQWKFCPIFSRYNIYRIIVQILSNQSSDTFCFLSENHWLGISAQKKHKKMILKNKNKGWLRLPVISYDISKLNNTRVSYLMWY